MTTANSKSNPRPKTPLFTPEEIPAASVATLRFPNGLLAINEHVEGAASVSVGLWIKAGSQDEPKSKAGIAHFIEHTVFKGTTGKSMREIMRSVESRGGLLNAFTTKEHTCYYTWTRHGELARATEILFELAARPKFAERDIKRERSVIIEEINGLEDEPDELVFDFFEREMFGDTPLARPIIGTAKSVSSLSRQDLLKFHAQHYHPANMAIVASGAQNHEEFFDGIRKSMKHLPPPKRSASVAKAPRAHAIHPTLQIKREGGQQAHVILGRKAPGIHSPNFVALNILITALGVGMSSRLSLRLREELGLAYDATAFYSPFELVGTIGVYVATAASNLKAVEREMRKILHGVVKQPLSPSELLRTKEQMIGSMILSLESTSSRMMRAGQNALYENKYVPVARELERVERVTIDIIRDVSRDFFMDESRFSLVSVIPDDHA